MCFSHGRHTDAQRTQHAQDDLVKALRAKALDIDEVFARAVQCSNEFIYDPCRSGGYRDRFAQRYNKEPCMRVAYGGPSCPAILPCRISFQISFIWLAIYNLSSPFIWRAVLSCHPAIWRMAGGACMASRWCGEIRTPSWRGIQSSFRLLALRARARAHSAHCVVCVAVAPFSE